MDANTATAYQIDPMDMVRIHKVAWRIKTGDYEDRDELFVILNSILDRARPVTESDYLDWLSCP